MEGDVGILCTPGEGHVDSMYPGQKRRMGVASLLSLLSDLLLEVRTDSLL